jgi:hypothetical protein
VTWRSEDDTVATISLDGMLVARSAGSTRITAELDESRASLPVTVIPPRVAAVHISAPPDSVFAGDSFGLMATPLDRWAGSLTERTVSWSVSDVNIAVVTAGGWVITRNPGLVMLTAVCEGVSASMSVNVLERAVEPVIPRARPDPIPWELPPEPRNPEPRRSRIRPGWFVAAGGGLLVAAGLWLVGGRRQPGDGLIPETALAMRDSSPADDPGPETAGYAVSAGDPVRGTAVVDSSGPASLTITRGRIARQQRQSTGSWGDLLDLHRPWCDLR